jgi:hypothetical protein
MTKNQPTKAKKVSIQERSVLVGEIIVVNGFGVDRTLLKQRFAEGCYETHETPHFILFRRPEPPNAVLVPRDTQRVIQEGEKALKNWQRRQKCVFLRENE